VRLDTPAATNSKRREIETAIFASLDDQPFVGACSALSGQTPSPQTSRGDWRDRRRLRRAHGG
jgi:hypothetical protein